MTDKDRILASIRQALHATRPESESSSGLSEEAFDRLADDSSDSGADLLEQFTNMVQSVGGHVITKEEAPGELTDDEHSFTVTGDFMVAENGAVWVIPPEDMQRADIFLAERLVIEVPAQNMVSNMHQAYLRISGQDYSYGTFISGPSKTADIEQSLVIGAQGPKKCIIVLT